MILLSRVFLVLVGIALAPGPALAQRYPDRPIRLIVAFPPGGSADIVARAVAPGLHEWLGQPIIIDNRPGAGGNIGVDAVAKAAPDGYTIGIGAAGALAVNVSLQEKLPFDPIKDLEPVTLLAEIPFVLIAAAAFPAQSLGDAVARAKAHPAEVSIGHGGNGTAMHLSGQLFNHMAGMAVPLVPYRGSAPVVGDVLAGHIALGVVDIPASLPLIQAGTIKALAVSTARRVSFLPEVPTFDEAGITGYNSVGWFGIVAPARTPPQIIARLNEAFVRVLNDADIRQRFRTVGAEPSPGSAEAFRNFIKSETEKWARVIALSGAKAQ